MDYTYYLGRECQYCQTEIADQTHAAREFCPRKVLDDGSIKSCKDDHHAALRKMNNAPFKGLVPHHERMRDTIRELYQAVGESVTREQINQYGVILNRPAEIGWNKESECIYYFIEYAFVRRSENQFKIIKHGKVF